MKRIVALMLIGLMLIGCGKADVKNTETENMLNTESENVSTEGIVNTEILDTEVVEITSEEVVVSPYTYTDLDQTMYAKSSVNVRDLPSTDGNKLGGLSWAQEVHVTGQCNETSWYRIEFEGGIAYVSNNYLVDTKPEPAPEPEPAPPIEQSPSPSYSEDEYTPEQRKIIEAGYWTLVKLSDTEYALATDGRKYMDDGTYIGIYFRNLLKDAGVYSHDIYFNWMDSEHYIYYAKNCFPYEGE